MKRANSIAYPTSGSSALEPHRNGFTVIEGTHKSTSCQSVPHPEQLSLMQSLKAILAVSAVVIALGITLVFSNTTAQQSFNNAFSNIPVTSVTVHTGDSLWDIAESHAPQGVSTAQVVRWITQENNLSSSCIQPGQTLIVPAS
jgi:LysM repeat protein